MNGTNFSTNTVFDKISTAGMALGVTTNLTLSARLPIMKIISFATGIPGLVFNSVSLIILTRYKPLRSYSSLVYILALTVAGELSSLLLVLNAVFDYPGGYHDKNDPWFFFLCKFWYARTFLLAVEMATVFLIVVLALDRYLAVVYPIFYKTKFTKMKVFPILLITSAFTIGIASVLPHSFIYVQISDKGQCTSVLVLPYDQRQYFLGIYTSVTQYLIPLGTIIVIYSRIAWLLHKRSNIITAMPSRGNVYTIGVGTEAGNRQVDVFREKSDGAVGSENISDSTATTSRDHSKWTSSESGKSRKVDKNIKENHFSTSIVARDSVLKTSLWIAIIYIFCFSAHQINYLLFNVGLVSSDSNSPMYFIRFILLYLHSCLNPLIYFINLEKFKGGLKFLTKALKRFFSSKKDKIDGADYIGC